jgi:hypothetical protein
VAASSWAEAAICLALMDAAALADAGSLDEFEAARRAQARF